MVAKAADTKRRSKAVEENGTKKRHCTVEAGMGADRQECKVKLAEAVVRAETNPVDTELKAKLQIVGLKGDETIRGI